MLWPQIIMYGLKLIDRTWDAIDGVGKRAIEASVKELTERNRIARMEGDVEEINATRAALDEIERRLRNRDNLNNDT